MKHIATKNNYQAQLHVRVLISILFVFALAFILLGRMMWLQVTHHEKYQELADGNRIRVEPIVPTRGRILDRNGLVLADNEVVYVLELHRDSLPAPRSLEKVIDTLTSLQADFSELDDAALRNLSQQWKRTNRHHPLTVSKISEAEAAAFAVKAWQYPGLNINAISQRIYPQGDRASHVVGYVGRITVEDLQKLDPENYRNTDHIGKRGIEQSYESELHGQTGLRYVEVNARGKTIRELERIAPTPGEDLLLTLDLPLQIFAEDILGDRKGAIVALDPNNGAVLAMASNPRFDPNLFVNGISHKDYQTLINDPRKPLLNRALQSRYPPGSTVKPIMGIIGLENNAITANTRKFAGSHFEHKGTIFRDWKRGGHGWVNLDTAITQSSDVYFYELALELTINRMDPGLKQFGLGKLTGIDLPSESPGLVPNPEWKRRTKNQAWYPGETIIAGIGQGSMLATPLQLAHSTALIAMKGQHFQPHLNANKEQRLADIKLSKEQYWQDVINPMINVMHAANGTGKRGGALANTKMAGKTGTSQVVAFAKDAKYNADLLPEEHRDHALFVGFAPVEQPQLAIAVMVENGGSGGATASPLAGLLVDYWLHRHPLRANHD